MNARQFEKHGFISSVLSPLRWPVESSLARWGFQVLIPDAVDILSCTPMFGEFPIL